MDVKKNILVIDKSTLSRNTYRLILGRYPQIVLQAVESIADADKLLLDGEEFDAMIFNANAAGRDFEIVQDDLLDKKPYNKMPKLLICAKNIIASWRDWCEDGLAVLLERPFHPDELVIEIKRLLNIDL